MAESKSGARYSDLSNGAMRLDDGAFFGGKIFPRSEAQNVGEFGMERAAIWLRVSFAQRCDAETLRSECQAAVFRSKAKQN